MFFMHSCVNETGAAFPPDAVCLGVRQNVHCTPSTMSATSSVAFSAVAPEVTGGSDLLQHFALRTHYDALQKQPPPEYVAQSGYLKKPVGDTALRRGEGMQLGQLLDPNWSGMASETTSIAPLGLEALRGAFTFRGEEPIELAQVRYFPLYFWFVRGLPIR